MDRICFTGGGTAGHVSPNLALIPYFIEGGYEVHYIGSKTGIEKDMIKPPVIFHPISTGKLRRYFDMKNFTDPFRIMNGYIQSRKLLKAMKPRIIFSKGGFVSVPVCVAAKHLGIPVVLHESDYSTGLANKLCTPYCSVICACFETAIAGAGDKGVLTGIPMRSELLKGNCAYAKSILQNFDFSKKTMMIMGGSLGAKAINDCVRSCLNELLKSYNIIHICGKGNLDISLNNKAGYAQYEFVSKELPDLLSVTDFVLSRSGATSIFEFLTLNKPMILIPLPSSSSRGDQILNAKYFEKQGFAAVLPQEELNASNLLATINHVRENLEKYKNDQKKHGYEDSNKKIIDILLSNMI